MSVDLYRKSMVSRTDKDDPRGPTFKLSLDEGGDYLFLNMVKDSFRGGHYHPFESFHLVLKGRIWFEFVEVSSGRRSETVVEAMEIVYIPGGVAHLLKALDDSMFMEPLGGLTEEYPPQRAFVKKFLKSNSGSRSE